MGERKGGRERKKERRREGKRKRFSVAKLGKGFWGPNMKFRFK